MVIDIIRDRFSLIELRNTQYLNNICKEITLSFRFVIHKNFLIFNLDYFFTVDGDFKKNYCL